MALFGPDRPGWRRLFLRVKRTDQLRARTSEFDPQRKLSLPLNHSNHVRDLFVSSSETLLSQAQQTVARLHNRLSSNLGIVLRRIWRTKRGLEAKLRLQD